MVGVIAQVAKLNLSTGRQAPAPITGHDPLLTYLPDGCVFRVGPRHTLRNE